MQVSTRYVKRTGSTPKVVVEKTFDKYHPVPGRRVESTDRTDRVDPFWAIRSKKTRLSPGRRPGDPVRAIRVFLISNTEFRTPSFSRSFNPGRCFTPAYYWAPTQTPRYLGVRDTHILFMDTDRGHSVFIRNTENTEFTTTYILLVTYLNINKSCWNQLILVMVLMYLQILLVLHLNWILMLPNMYFKLIIM